MARWVCPDCEREFARTRQSHDCRPGNTVDDTFRPWPAVYREIYDRIAAHLDDLGEWHDDAVKVGVFLKREQKLCEIRPKARSLNASLYLRRPVEHRLGTTPQRWGSRVITTLKFTGLDQIDDEVLALFTEAFDEAGGP